MGFSSSSSAVLLLVVIFSSALNLLCFADPTDGFTEIPITDANIYLEKPFDIALDHRYSFIDGVRRFWVYTNDKPLRPGSNTRPRTELRFVGLDYSSGIRQFEGHAYVPAGTSGVTIMQIHGARSGNTTLLLRIYNGDMRYYSSDVFDRNLYDRWFRLNVIHNVDEGHITVFIDGVQKYAVKDQGPGDLFFKCGVYGAPVNSSYYMESRWRDIKIFKK